MDSKKDQNLSEQEIYVYDEKYHEKLLSDKPWMRE
jgi:hypothetical protein